jgi:hypothetical protein
VLEPKCLRARGRSVPFRSLLHTAGLISEGDGRGDIRAERGQGGAFSIAIAHYVSLYQR